jgi:hypothetical protein
MPRKNWSAKNVKTFAIHEGAMTASLYLDNKKVASVEDHGNGGGNLYHFEDRKLEQEFYSDALEAEGEFGNDMFFARLCHLWETMKIQRKFERKGYPYTMFIEKDPAEWDADYYHDSYFLAMRNKNHSDFVAKREKADRWRVYDSTGEIQASTVAFLSLAEGKIQREITEETP